MERTGDLGAPRAGLATPGEVDGASGACGGPLDLERPARSEARLHALDERGLDEQLLDGGVEAPIDQPQGAAQAAVAEGGAQVADLDRSRLSLHRALDA